MVEVAVEVLLAEHGRVLGGQVELELTDEDLALISEGLVWMAGDVLLSKYVLMERRSTLLPYLKVLKM